MEQDAGSIMLFKSIRFFTGFLSILPIPGGRILKSPIFLSFLLSNVVRFAVYN